MAKTKSGVVYFVGAGPGSPGLLTSRGAELLRRADVVVHDGEAAHAVLQGLASDCEVVNAAGTSSNGSHPGPRNLATLLLERARAGKEVVRLLADDPFVFGPGGTEMADVAASGVDFEIVPGVSSVSAALACAGIPVTHRAVASAFTVVTAPDASGGAGADVDWGRIARMHGTKVITWNGRGAPAWAPALVAGGLSESTPVAWIEAGTTPRQRVLVSSLGTLAGELAGQSARGPGIAVVGEVVRLRESLAWFERRPWFGQRMVVIRAGRTPEPIAAALREHGADVVEAQVCQITAPPEREPMIEALAGLGDYDWIVFGRPEAVPAFFETFFRAFDDVRSLGNLRIAARNAATAERIRDLRLRVDALPGTPDGRALADVVEEREGVEGRRFLVVTGGEMDPEMVGILEERGGTVDEVPFYRRAASPEAWASALTHWGGGTPDWIVVPDAEAVAVLRPCEDPGAVATRLPGVRWGALTEEAREALGVPAILLDGTLDTSGVGGGGPGAG